MLPSLSTSCLATKIISMPPQPFLNSYTHTHTHTHKHTHTHTQNSRIIRNIGRQVPNYRCHGNKMATPFNVLHATHIYFGQNVSIAFIKAYAPFFVDDEGI